MKKILLIIMTVSASFAFNNANAQWCGTVSNCIPNPTVPVGFETPDSVPCAKQGVAYNNNITFQMYSSFTFQGTHNIDSITIDTIYNLPCGLCWSLNKASRTYSAGEFGCINITGTTNDAVGQYNLRMVITAYLTGASAQTIPPNLVDASGIKNWVRVSTAGGACTSVDTSSGAANQVAATVCPNGINEVAANVVSVNIMPNPMSSSAILSFIAERTANYSVKITDITGQVVSVKEIQAVSGVNTTSIERSHLSSGIYFLSLTDGVSSVTRRFTIAD